MNRNMKQRTFAVLVLAIVALTLLLSGCKDFSFFSELGIKGELKLSPSAVTMTVDTSLTFIAIGGNPPYTYQVISGSGTIDPATGVYMAPSSASIDIVMAVDSTGESGTATVSVVTTLDVLAIMPNSVTVPVGSSLSFVAAGEVGSCTFDIPTNNSGGSIDPDTGEYTAGFTTGIDTIRVTDSDTPTPNSVTANVTVTAFQTYVDYTINSGEDTFPASALAGSSLSGDFTITNTDTGTGTAAISWWLFISEDGTFGGGGEHLVASGVETADIPGSGTCPVTPSGSWPTDLPQGDYQLYVLISSPDDLNYGNNEYDGGVLTLNVPDVDYQVVSVTQSDLTPRYGEDISGAFELANAGSDNSTAPAQWEVWISEDATIGAGDIKIASGTESLPYMTAGETPYKLIDFSLLGAWPNGTGNSTDYHILVRASSSQDTAAGNDGADNTGDSGAVTVYQPQVDYYADTITAAGGVAGDTLNCSFNLNNGGSDDSTSTVVWNLYVSTNNTLDAGDYLATWGTYDSLGKGASVPISPVGAAWPTTPGSYFLIVQIESQEDVAAGKDGNDVAVSGATFGVTAPKVDYIVTQVNHTGGAEKAPGQYLEGDFAYANNGPHDGARELSWTVYASDNDTLSPDDIGVASGNGLTPLDVVDPPKTVTFSGYWPLDYGDYFLIAQVISLDDEQLVGNDSKATSGPIQIGIYTESEPNDEYKELPGGPGGYDILYGVDINTPIALEPGMSIRIEGLDINWDDYGMPNPVPAGQPEYNDNDTFMFNTGSANSITFTLTWNTGNDCLAIFIYEAGGPAPPPPVLASLSITGWNDELSKTITLGGGAEQFSANQDLWFNVYYKPASGYTDLYTAIITAN